MGRKNRHVRHYFGIASLATIIVAYICYCLFRSLPLLSPHSIALTAPASNVQALPWPGYGQAAVGAVGYGVLATNGAQTPLPTASIAKVMTALCVLKQKPIAPGDQGPMITIDQDDVDSYNKYVAEDGSVVPVSVGEQISEYQALQALLLPSANNIAETLARWAFGSIDAYNAYANQYANQLKLASIHITDPSGFLPDTVASAADLTLLGETAMQNPVIAGIANQSTADVPVAGSIRNVNRLLGQNGTIGLKTGNNDQDLGAYLFAANTTVGGKTITVVGAIMDGPDLGTALYDSLPLIKTAQANFKQVTLLKAGQPVASYDVPWQGKVDVVTQKALSETIWSGDKLTLASQIQTLDYPYVPGQQVGNVLSSDAAKQVHQKINLVLKTPLHGPNIWWRLTHPR